MSEGHTHNFLEEKMAIPEGGVEERMDVSAGLEDTGNDGCDYVSVNVKGPGRPICILSGDNITEASSWTNDEERTDAALHNVLNIPTIQAEIEESVEELQNKKAGNTQTLPSSTPDTSYPESTNPGDLQGNYIPTKTVTQKKDAENHCPSIDYKENSVHSDLGFQSQVISLCNRLSSTESPSIKKYKAVQEQDRKKIGTKKSGQGKEPTGLRLVNREHPYIIDIEGKKHRLQISLVPVEDVADTQCGQQHDGIAEHDNELDKEQKYLWDGSIDRPLESSFGIEREWNSSKVTYPDAIYQQPCSSYNEPGDSIAPVVERFISDTDENTIDQPLDLTVEKPLDLRLSSTRINESNSLAAPYDMASMSMDVRAESISTIESNSEDVVADAQDLNLYLCLNANQYEAVNNDGNLTSPSILTLESSDQQYTATVAVQESAVRPEVLQNSSGQQRTINLLGNQLKADVRQQLKAAVRQQSTSTPAHRIPAVESPLQEKVLARSNWMNGPEQVIPIPAMPDLQGLELVNTKGHIMESKEEYVKNRLKKKLLLNKMS